LSQVGAPLGNKNNTKAKPWADAIRRSLARREDGDHGKSLNELADALLDKAAEGDMSALKELGDRLDGKSAQSVTVGNEDGKPFSIEQVIRSIVDPKHPHA